MNSNGLPSLNNKFKDLNLQLHASTTVTNPYTFNIQGNCSFSASVESAVPETTTELYFYQDYGNSKELDIIIPAGVTKLFTYIQSYQGAPYPTISNYSDVNNPIVWNDSDMEKKTLEVPHNGNKINVRGTIVQVTPDKTYNVIAVMGPVLNPQVAGQLMFGLWYSKSINNMTAQIIDL